MQTHIKYTTIWKEKKIAEVSYILGNRFQT